MTARTIAPAASSTTGFYGSTMYDRRNPGTARTVVISRDGLAAGECPYQTSDRYDRTQQRRNGSVRLRAIGSFQQKAICYRSASDWIRDRCGALGAAQLPLQNGLSELHRTIAGFAVAPVADNSTSAAQASSTGANIPPTSSPSWSCGACATIFLCVICRRSS